MRASSSTACWRAEHLETKRRRRSGRGSKRTAGSSSGAGVTTMDANQVEKAMAALHREQTGSAFVP